MRTSAATRSVAVAAAALAVLASAGTSSQADDGPSTRHVYEATNAADGNAVQVFDVAPDGTLTAGELVPTGGTGLGASLGSQGGITRWGRHLLVVNAGDDTVSSFLITGRGLKLVGTAPSGGDRPVSVTVSYGRVLVLNQGSDTISGLRLDENGGLRPLTRSTRALSGSAVGAAQVQFAGERIAVVTEKTTNRIDTFAVDLEGRPSAATVTASAGAVPYGFDVDRRHHLVVSEAAAGAVSSYRATQRGVVPITASLSDTQAAPCWLVLSPSGRYAWTTNAGSGTISAYAVAANGSLTLLSGTAGTPGAGPTDVAVSSDGAHLFARIRTGEVAAFTVAADGSLTPLGTAAGATAIGSSGLAAD